MKQISLIKFIRRPTWDAHLREANWQARQKANFKCEVCGGESISPYAGYRLVVHHKDENWLNNSSENLLVLCQSCHQRTHDRMQKKKGET